MNYSISSNSKLITTKEWEDFLYTHPEGNYFQSELYYNFHKSLQDSDPYILHVKNQKNEVEGILLCVFQKTNSKDLTRCIIYGGPLVNVNGKETEIYKLLFEMLESLISSNYEYIEIRNLFIKTKQLKIFKKHSFTFNDHLNIIINTSSSNPLENISKKKLKQVEQSIKNGAEIIEAQNINQVKEFYSILLNLYKNKVKKILPQWDFFQNFYTQSKKTNSSKYFLVKFNNQIIGGIMCPIFYSKTIYEWYICGLDKEFQGIHPSILATYGAIEYAKKKNITQFDFMGAGKPDIEYGVRTFKKQFGGEMVNYGRYIRNNF